MIVENRMLYPMGAVTQDPEAIAYRMAGSQELVTFGQLEKTSN